MRNHWGWAGLALVFWTAAATPAGATPIVAGSTLLPGRAIQDITLLPMTAFNPYPFSIVISGLYGDGYLLLNRDAQVGSTINIPTLDGQFFGSNPLLGSYVFGRVGTLTPADFSGSITNVVQNPVDTGYAAGLPSSFASGDLTFGGPSFGFEFLTGPAAGAILYTDTTTPFQFVGTLNGLPPSQQTVLQNSGTDVLNVLFNGEVVAETSNRRIVLAAVPEPSALAMLASGMIGVGWAARRRIWSRGRAVPPGGRAGGGAVGSHAGRFM